VSAATTRTAPSRSRLSAAILGGLLTAASLGACAMPSTQRWPPPMKARASPLPSGDSAAHPPGPEEVSIVRHADPVQIRPAGALSGHPLAFYDKRARLSAGGAVIVSPGGRAEILWPGGSSVVLFGEAVGWVGSPSRGEPMFELQELDRARLDLQQGDQVRLLGGSVLTGASGPYVIDHESDATLLVHNQSKGPVQLAFREEVFDLGPGQAVRIPLLSSGGAPFVEDPDLQRFSGSGFNVRLLGELECAEVESGVRVAASPEGGEGREARALGVRVRLAAGDSCVFREPWVKPAPQPRPEEPSQEPPPAEGRPSTGDQDRP
jgi:hypothetical protein